MKTDHLFTKHGFAVFLDFDFMKPFICAMVITLYSFSLLYSDRWKAITRRIHLFDSFACISGSLPSLQSRNLHLTCTTWFHSDLSTPFSRTVYANSLFTVFSKSLEDLEAAHNLHLRKVFEMKKQKKAKRGYDKNPIFTPERMFHCCHELNFTELAQHSMASIHALHTIIFKALNNPATGQPWGNINDVLDRVSPDDIRSFYKHLSMVTFIHFRY